MTLHIVKKPFFSKSYKTSRLKGSFYILINVINTVNVRICWYCSRKGKVFVEGHEKELLWGLGQRQVIPRPSPLSGFAFANIATDSISWESCSAFKHETSAILTLIFVFVSRGIQLSFNVKGALSAFLEHIAIKGKLQNDGSVLFTITLPVF